MKNTSKVLAEINLPLLLVQKQDLIATIDTIPEDGIKDSLNGILNLLDAIHDELDPPSIHEADEPEKIDIYKLTEGHMLEIILVDNFKEALMQVQGIIGVDSGDVAGLHFADVEDVDAAWSVTKNRRRIINGYLEAEERDMEERREPEEEESQPIKTLEEFRALHKVCSPEQFAEVYGHELEDFKDVVKVHDYNGLHIKEYEGRTFHLVICNEDWKGRLEEMEELLWDNWGKHEIVDEQPSYKELMADLEPRIDKFIASYGISCTGIESLIEKIEGKRLFLDGKEGFWANHYIRAYKSAKELEPHMRTVAIEFDSSGSESIVTRATDEELQGVMSKFEELPEFLDDSYTYEDFFNFLQEQGIKFTKVEKPEQTLYFDRSKQS